MRKTSGHHAIQAIADPRTFLPWTDQFDRYSAVSPEYGIQVQEARAMTGVDEAVVTGEIHVGGVPAVVIAWEFGFLGGSVGVATATRIVAAIRRATAAGRPLLALPRSGGTRMQEGAPAFVQMVAIAGAIAEHRAAGLPYLVHLCGPTTGGVLATLGSAGDITTAEPGAMIGFLGPRAYAAITGQEFPPGVQTADNLQARGLVDAVLPWDDLRQRWATLLGLWSDRPRVGGPEAGGPPTGAPGRRPVPGAPTTAAELWRYVEASREHDRVDAQQFIAAHATDVVTLPGTGAGERSAGALVALGRLRGVPVVLAATEDRWTGEPLAVGGLRTIRRAIALAGRWGLPVVTIVDTLGAQLSVAGEESGIAGEISRVMVDLVSAPVPTVALLLGAGTGGAALALLASDRIVAGSHTWVAPLAPEGAAAIRHGGTHDPAQMAWEQRIGAHALAELGFVDTLVRESEADWVATAAQAVVDSVSQVLGGTDPRRRVERFAAWSATNS
jgi:acetyl-CoA carboxylase carboxyl transferase subunit beta